MTPKEEFMFSVLVVKCLEGSISESELAELNERLITDPDAPKIYAEQMYINSNLKYPGNLGTFKVIESDFDTGEFDAEIDNYAPKVAMDSNVSMRGVDLEEFMVGVNKDDGDYSDMTHDLLEILELERISPAVEIPKEEPKRELIQKVERNFKWFPGEGNKALTRAYLAFAACIMVFIGYVYFFSPDPVGSVDVASVVDLMDVSWHQSDISFEKGERLWTDSGLLGLEKGIVSIEYDDGVEVVIEAPALFEVERSGLYLEYGRLYSKVSQTGLGFTVRTPTSQFVDQGTEFGVVADINGSSELHVTKGKVQLFAGLKGHSRRGQMVTENSAVRFDSHDGKTNTIEIQKKAFVRNIDSNSGFIWKGQTRIDLSDIFGGGNGFGSGQTSVALDVRNGKFTSLRGGYETKTGKQKPDKTFITVDESPYIDSVFMPDGGDDSVQVSSAGHIFDNCPDTGGWLNDYNIFNGETIKLGVNKWPVQLGNQLYGTKENPAITIRANRGITFDLWAIRRSLGISVFERFTVRCGVNQKSVASEEMTDIYVLVDGRVSFKTLEKTKKIEPSIVDVALSRNDRFLTLVVTQGDESEKGNWVVFAEPVLHLSD